MKIKLFFLVLLTVIVGALAIRLFGREDSWICDNGQWVKHGSPAAEKPTIPCGEDQEKIVAGRIASILNKEIMLENEPLKITIKADTKIITQTGEIKELLSLKRSFNIKATGKQKDNSIEAREIIILNEPNIIIFEPVSNAEVDLPLRIRGEARVFENTFSYRVKDGNGNILTENHAMADAPDSGFYGPFDLEVNYPKPNSKQGLVEVFEYSAKDGAEINKVAIPVYFKDIEATGLKVYFPNSKKDPAMQDCGKVFEVERRVAKTAAPARAALEELFRGPDNQEDKDGYFTSINEGVKIQKLTIENGIAKVDLSKELEVGIGGSCRVASIRAQITQTLKQFPTVKEVIISVDGRTEEILQP